MAIKIKGTIEFEGVVLGNELKLLKEVKDKLQRGEKVPFEDLDFLLGLSEGFVSGRVTDNVGLERGALMEYGDNALVDRDSELPMRTLDVRVKVGKDGH